MRSTYLSLALTAVVQHGIAAPVTSTTTPSCFPYGNATLPSDGSVPDVPLDQWWCPQSMAYGFQGFSYPMENPDCNATVNSFEQMDRDFARMKRDFGASIVRMYYPVCTEEVIFERAVRAAINNNMGLIFQVWTNFGIGDVWKQSRQAIYDILENPKYKDIIPYVVHWADFGSEPVGDGMDGGREKFVYALGRFRDHMHAHNITAGISEDWDRPGIMSNCACGPNQLGTALGPIGKGVAANSDYAHIHPMPYYHFNDPESEAWSYIREETLWVKKYVDKPIFITESPWAWGPNSHNPNKTHVGVPEYTKYWKKYDSECEWFKEQNIGWFLHAWRGETTFDIIFPNNTYVIPDWRPMKC